MKIEVIRDRKYFYYGLCLGVILLIIISINNSLAKYQNTIQMDLVKGTINYKPYDFKVMAMYTIDGEEEIEITKIPEVGYKIAEEKSYCTIDNVNHDSESKLYTNYYGEHIMSGLKKNSKCYIYFIKDYLVYTGGVQTFTAEKSGNYQIELWGASGGDIDKYTGGNGAYTKGNIFLEKGTEVYVYVGSAGYNQDGSYNGGGIIAKDQFPLGRSGGGATDVRIYKSEDELWNNFDSLKSRIMVAAGGGGANNRNVSHCFSNNDCYNFGAGNGGAGGTLIGVDGESVDWWETETYTSYNDHQIGTGGTQSEGGYIVFYNSIPEETKRVLKGYFGYVVNGSQSGGGSGYYAGGNGGHGGAGGGSSFVSGCTGCDAIDENSTEDNIIHTGQPNHYSGYVFSDIVMIDGNSKMPTPTGGTSIGNDGNGYAKITFLGYD